jgi:hypothetical protein
MAVRWPGGEDELGTLPPHDHVPVRRDVPTGTLASEFLPVVYFRDSAGLRWTLLADGHLEEYTGPRPPARRLLPRLRSSALQAASATPRPPDPMHEQSRRLAKPRVTCANRYLEPRFADAHTRPGRSLLPDAGS